MRDFLTARAFGAAVRLIPTALTEQSPAGVRGVERRPPIALIGSVADALRLGADAAAAVTVKIGMLPDGAAVDATIAALEGFAGPVVFDPVLAASSGGAPLFAGDLAALLRLGARATLMTPNAIEAAALTGLPLNNRADAEAAARSLRDRGVRAVLIKGGHLPVGTSGGDDHSTAAAVSDTLLDEEGVTRFQSARVSGPSVRGTGCALATAIAIGLGRGLALRRAVTEARLWLVAGLAHPVAALGEWHLP